MTAGRTLVSFIDKWKSVIGENGMLSSLAFSTKSHGYSDFYKALRHYLDADGKGKSIPESISYSLKRNPQGVVSLLSTCSSLLDDHSLTRDKEMVQRTNFFIAQALRYIASSIGSTWAHGIDPVVGTLIFLFGLHGDMTEWKGKSVSYGNLAWALRSGMRETAEWRRSESRDSFISAEVIRVLSDYDLTSAPEELYPIMTHSSNADEARENCGLVLSGRVKWQVYNEYGVAAGRTTRSMLLRDLLVLSCATTTKEDEEKVVELMKAVRAKSDNLIDSENNFFMSFHFLHELALGSMMMGLVSSLLTMGMEGTALGMTRVITVVNEVINRMMEKGGSLLPSVSEVMHQIDDNDVRTMLDFPKEFSIESLAGKTSAAMEEKGLFKKKEEEGLLLF